ncbi:MAG: flocculation-associated PEP-CTERM protein PepA [Roseateles asaccharophilus]|uniref:flocculation-associated PEP-CTERM protein PepA n=1 Tax=Roseateles asaccharophilus TaxID=582607 RepID=UPI00391ACDE1
MNFKKLAATAAIASLAALSGGMAVAAPTLTNLDGSTSPFGGFDWASGSAAWTSGFSGAPGSNFNLNYVGWATAVTNTSGTPMGGLLQFDNTADGIANSLGAQFSVPGKTGSYEYTVVASFTEKIVACVSATECTFQVTGGTFDIYYDTAANAKTVAGGAWTGFGDGTKIVSGTFFAGPATLFNTLTGGQADLQGVVTYTNAAYINPALVSTNVTSTLQLGSAVTSFSAPTSVDGNVVGAGQIVFQADANQTFSSKVPEPGSLALVGLALTGVAALSRRRKSVKTA